jgi:hypothetical protein
VGATARATVRDASPADRVDRDADPVDPEEPADPADPDANARTTLRSIARLLLSVLGALVLAPGPPAAANERDCDLPLFTTRPAPGDPTPVSIGIYVLDVPRIDDRDQTFTVDFALRVSWLDPRIARAGAGPTCTIPLEAAWNPRIRLFNQRDVRKQFKEALRVDASGRVSYEQRFTGELTSHADLSRFPFDARVLTISTLAVDHSPADVKLVASDIMGTADVMSVANWTIQPGSPRFHTFKGPGGREFPRFDFELEAERRPAYYVSTLLIPLILIVMMSWSVFWINPSHLGSQLGLAATSMLTLIAYRFTLGNLLPPVPYLTRMDVFIAGSTVLVFLALVEAVATGSLADRSQERLAQRIDVAARVAFPASFLVLMALAFL